MEREVYIYERVGYLHSLIEIYNYSNANDLKCCKTEDDDGSFKFIIDVSTDVELHLIVRKEQKQEKLTLINLTIIPIAKHQKYTDKVSSVLKVVGAVGLGGVGAVTSILTPGVGWIFGGGITAVMGAVGSFPGRVFNHLDDSLSESLLKKCNMHVRRLLGLFDENLVNMSKDFPDKERDRWIDDFISNKNLKLFSINKKMHKVTTTIEFNHIEVLKNTVKLYDTYLISKRYIEIKKKHLDLDSLKSLEMNGKYTSEYCYDEWIHTIVYPKMKDKESKTTDGNSIDMEKLKSKFNKLSRY